jgi:hypothetical protein
MGRPLVGSASIVAGRARGERIENEELRMENERRRDTGIQTFSIFNSAISIQVNPRAFERL